MKSKGFTVLKTAIVLLTVVFLVYQTYSVLYKPVTTATAYSFNTYEGVDITGYFVRDEKIIEPDTTGAIRYVIADGEKVSKGGTVAEIYESADTVALFTQIEELEEQIATLNSINSASDPSSVDLATVNNKINKAYIQLLASGDNGSFEESGKYSAELLTLVNKKQVLTGDVTGFDTLLSSLNTQLADLKSRIKEPIGTVKAESEGAAQSGYFVSGIDGMELILNVDNIESIDEDVYNKLASATPKTGFGKIVSDYNWYIIAKMENDEYHNFIQDTTVTIKTTIEGSTELKAKVYKVNKSKTSNSAIVIFSCNTMNGLIAATRSAPMTVVTNDYEGIRISNDAVRILEGQTGVYVVQGSVVKFKPIEIIYTGDDYVLCKLEENAGSNSLRLYDEVIEKGKNLYDGKFIG